MVRRISRIEICKQCGTVYSADRSVSDPVGLCAECTEEWWRASRA